MSFVVNFLLAHTLCFGGACAEHSDFAQDKLHRSIQYGHVPDSSATTQEIQSAVSRRDSIVNYAKTFLGIPYNYANADPSCGFDCSGFTWFVFNHFNIVLPRSSRDYINTGKPVSLDSCRKGDLILFTGTDHRVRTVGHVGIIISNPGDSVKFIHSSSSKNHPGVTITNYYKSNYPKRFMGVRDVLSK